MILSLTIYSFSELNLIACSPFDLVALTVYWTGVDGSESGDDIGTHKNTQIQNAN